MFVCLAIELLELKILRENYASFGSVITDVDHLTPHFVERRIIFTDELEEIKSTVRSSDKVAILLRNVTHQLKAQNTTGFYDMLQIMEVHGLMATEDLANKVRKLLSEHGKQIVQTEGKPNVYVCMHVCMYVYM